MSEDESPSSITSQETGFKAHLYGEDMLWSVHEITGENKVKYKVKWMGVDPDTGKPWPESWIPKSDCTDDLVDKWKAKNRNTVSAARGPIACTSLRKPQAEQQLKRRQQHGEDTFVTEGRSSKKYSKKEKALRTPSHPPMKVGPPRGVPKQPSACFRPQPPSPSSGSSARDASSAKIGSITAPQGPQHGTKFKRGGEDPSSDDLLEEEGRLSKKRRYKEDVQRAPNPSSPHPMKVGPPRGVPKNLNTDASLRPPIQPPGVELSPSTRDALEAFDHSMEESERTTPPDSLPNIPLECNAMTVINKNAPVAEPKIKEASNHHNTPELAAQAKELKRLYLTINTAANTALELLNEVVEAIESGQDSQTRG